MAACLLDTNVILYLLNPVAPQHCATAGALERTLASGSQVVVAAQCIFEFWSVATRPADVNGLGWSIERATAAVATIRSRFPVLPEPPEVLDLWLHLVLTHGLKGKRVHDAHLLATMKANGITL